MNLRQLNQQQQGDAAKMHIGASVDRETGNELGGYFPDELGDAVNPLVLLLVERIAERCSHYGSVEFQLGSHDISLGTLIILFSLHFL